MLEDKMKLRVRKDRCIGCGLCADSCPWQAISVEAGQAHIDQSRCNHCGLCLQMCPQGAIVEVVSVSKAELAGVVASLRQEADDLIQRIERLRTNSVKLD